MMYATKIKMQRGCDYSQNLIEIDEIYLEGCNNPGFFKKEGLHDYLKDHPGTIKVKCLPYPDLLPIISVKGEKFVQHISARQFIESSKDMRVTV